MASLSDYGIQRSKKDSAKGHMPWRLRFLGQCIFAALFFLAIAKFGGYDNTLGDYSRYIAKDGLSMETSWLPYEKIVTASANLESRSEPPSFLLPISGVVVSDISFDQSGTNTASSIIIKGESGDEVKATAAGTVSRVLDVDGVLMVEVTHEGGFVSNYQGMQKVNVQQNQEVASGDTLGIAGDKEIIFSLTLNGEAQDPLLWLFKEDDV